MYRRYSFIHLGHGQGNTALDMVVVLLYFVNSRKRSKIKFPLKMEGVDTRSGKWEIGKGFRHKVFAPLNYLYYIVTVVETRWFGPPTSLEKQN